MPSGTSTDHPVGLHAPAVVLLKARRHIHLLQRADGENAPSATARKVRDPDVRGLAGRAKVARVEWHVRIKAAKKPQEARHKDKGVVVDKGDPAEGARPEGGGALHVDQRRQEAILRM